LVVLLAGVNGVGKTTTVAKLAALLKAERGPVIVAASDTFRAAAIDQLQVWCDRVGVDLIKQKQGSDPAAVAFDAVKAAKARNAAAVLIDTAGRLQTKVNLMEELKKIARVVGRELPGAPHETWLVLDATTGQNALSQAKLFGDAVPLTGVVLAKLDSTAKGGVIVGIADRLKLPVRFVGLGEAIEDLREFDPREFVDALFAEGAEERETASGTYAA
jgi:fused signal recognition particle receptor